MYSIKTCIKSIIEFHKLKSISQISQRHIKRHIRPTLIELTKRKRKLKETFSNPRNEYLEWNWNAELFAFNSRLTEKFDLELLKQAFTHRSYIINETEKQKQVGIENPILDLVDNTEFIIEGEQIVPLIIENYLSHALPLAPQECIYALKNYLLSTEILAKTSSCIGVKDLILSMERHPTEETLAKTFYALISALNRSVNLEHASLFVRDILISLLVEKDLTEIWCVEDPISILNDILSRENKELAEPRIIAQTGINTLLSVYQIAVYSNKKFLGSGIGETIEEAKNMAALNTLHKMFGLLDSSKPIRCNLKIDDSGSKNLPLTEWRSQNA
ncbi:PREDICTED: 39S ribosomal protein L44, mitochondrial [Ceratosolen solmsi marchali]|uniref:Large ribosomal subunit protein mL44 n=1 Tax=Ceratosolen solmsi marchali TaxID=326594 RepID=A0AAJ7DZE0_9HYME|nr:PREDICTED: 39S ribosomal protein L44, mitochondrial [Ceratosolen solmsi marchali]